MPVTRLSRPLHGPESQVRTHPLPAAKHALFGRKPPLRASHAVQKLLSRTSFSRCVAVEGQHRFERVFRAAHFRRRVFATARLQLSILRAGYQAPRSGTATHCKTPRVARTRCRRVGVTRRDGLQTILFVGRVSHRVRVRRYSLFDPFPPRFLDPFAAVAPGQQTPR